MVEKRVKKFGQGSPPPLFRQCLKEIFFFRLASLSSATQQPAQGGMRAAPDRVMNEERIIDHPTDGEMDRSLTKLNNHSGDQSKTKFLPLVWVRRE